MTELRVYTVGHSTRSMDELLDLLNEHAVENVIDVRRFPGSRRHPQFSQDALKASLAGAGLSYLHKVELGGRRPCRADSRNTAWRNASFRGYADHMDSPEFRVALRHVMDYAGRSRSALMCAEALPHRCHRRLVADALVVQGASVLHIIGPGRVEPHALNPAAQVLEDGRLLYAEPVAEPVDRVSAGAPRELVTPAASLGAHPHGSAFLSRQGRAR